LYNIPAVNNPVIVGDHVSDVPSPFVADPFLVYHDSTFYMFFEIYNLETNQTDISYARSANGYEWNYGKVILDEEFNLSYPNVFELNGEFYMIPETAEDYSVRLYRAV